ncbi:MAG: hypothetical protein CMD03_00195, partial [Flavobacteriales bacterium]|nr:hypothetical protein [Flavobacteriales bacterium]
MILDNLINSNDDDVSKHESTSVNLYIITILTLWKSICTSIKNTHEADILQEIQDDAEAKEITENSKKSNLVTSILADVELKKNKIAETRKEEIQKIDNKYLKLVKKEDIDLESAKKKYNDNIEKYNKNIDNIEVTLNEIINHLNKKKTEISQKRKTNAEKKVKLTSEIKTIISDANMLNNSIKKNTQKLKDKDKEIEEKKNEKTGTKQKISNLNANIEKINREINELTIQINSQNISSNRAKTIEIAKEIADMKVKQETKKEDLGQNKEKLKNEEAELARLENYITKKQNEKNKLSKQIEKDKVELKKKIGAEELEEGGINQIDAKPMDKNFDEYTEKYTGELKIKIEELQKINRDFVQLEDVDKENSDQEWGIIDDEEDTATLEDDSKSKKIALRTGLKNLFLKTQEIKNEFFIEDRKAELDINKNEYFIYKYAFDRDISEDYEEKKVTLLPKIIKFYNMKDTNFNDAIQLKESEINNIDNYNNINLNNEDVAKNEYNILLPHNIFRLFRNEYIRKKDIRFLSKKDYRIYNNFNTYINTKIINDEKFNNYNSFKNGENNDNIKNLLDTIDDIVKKDNETYKYAIISDDKLSSLISVLREKKNELFDESNNNSEQESKDNKKISKKKIIEEIFFNRFKLVKITEIKNLDPIISVKKDELEDKEDRTEKETINNKRKMQLILNINEKIKKSIGDPDVKFRYFYFQYRYIVETKNCWMFSDEDLETDKKNDNGDVEKDKSKITTYRDKMNEIKEIELGTVWPDFTKKLWEDIFEEIEKINEPQKFLDIFINMLDNIFEKKGDIEERKNLRKILKNTTTREILFEKMRFFMQKGLCEKMQINDEFKYKLEKFIIARDGRKFDDFLRETYKLSILDSTSQDKNPKNLFLEKIKIDNEIEKCEKELALLEKQKLFKLQDGSSDEEIRDINEKISDKEQEEEKLLSKQIEIMENSTKLRDSLFGE